MLECLTKINWKKVGLFASGTLFGTAGIKVLASDDAKKVYKSFDDFEYSIEVLGTTDIVIKGIGFISIKNGTKVSLNVDPK